MPTRTVTRAAAVAAAVLAALPLVAVPGAWAQGDGAAGYPKGPVRVIVGFAPGGGNDLVARVLTPKLSERMGQPFVVENRPGAGSTLAGELVARATPDGYTLLIAPAGMMVINPAVYSKLPYDSLTSYELISTAVTYPFVLSVSATSSIKSVKELIEWGKANPDKANYGSTSTVFQLPSELFNMKTGTRFEHIPFKSGGEIVAGIITGQVTMAFADTGAALSQIRGGKLRPLATTGRQRLPELSDIPTLTEAGVPDLIVEGFTGLAAPKGTPQPIVKKLEAELIAIVKLPDIREKLSQIGMQPAGETGEQFTARVTREIPMWKDVAQKAKIKLD